MNLRFRLNSRSRLPLREKKGAHELHVMHFQKMRGRRSYSDFGDRLRIPRVVQLMILCRARRADIGKLTLNAM